MSVKLSASSELGQPSYARRWHLLNHVFVLRRRQLVDGLVVLHLGPLSRLWLILRSPGIVVEACLRQTDVFFIGQLRTDADLLLLLRLEDLAVVRLVLVFLEFHLFLEAANHRGAFLDDVLLLKLLVGVLLLLKLVLLDLHLQGLVVGLLAVLVDLLNLLQVGLGVLLPSHIFLSLHLRLLCLRHLGGDIDVFHVPLVDVSLLLIDFALKLLVSLLVHEKWIPVELCLWLGFLDGA